MRFTVRPDQGEANGFDLGDILVSGPLGEASSVGHVPDQGMMLYLSVPELLESLTGLLTRRSSSASFSGIDSSFGLGFRMKRKTITVAGRSGPVAQVSRAELAEAVLSAAEELAGLHIAPTPARALTAAQDPARGHYLDVLQRFRLVAAQVTGSSAA